MMDPSLPIFVGRSLFWAARTLFTRSLSLMSNTCSFKKNNQFIFKNLCAQISPWDKRTRDSLVVKNPRKYFRFSQFLWKSNVFQSWRICFLWFPNEMNENLNLRGIIDSMVSKIWWRKKNRANEISKIQITTSQTISRCQNFHLNKKDISTTKCTLKMVLYTVSGLHLSSSSNCIEYFSYYCHVHCCWVAHTSRLSIRSNKGIFWRCWWICFKISFLAFNQPIQQKWCTPFQQGICVVFEEILVKDKINSVPPRWLKCRWWGED